MLLFLKHGDKRVKRDAYVVLNICRERKREREREREREKERERERERERDKNFIIYL